MAHPREGYLLNQLGYASAGQSSLHYRLSVRGFDVGSRSEVVKDCRSVVIRAVQVQQQEMSHACRRGDLLQRRGQRCCG